MRSEVNAIM